MKLIYPGKIQKSALNSTDVRRVFDSSPKLIKSISCLRRHEKKIVDAQIALQRSEFSRPFVATLLIYLGSNYGKIAVLVTQPIDELLIALLRRNVRIHQAYTQLKWFPQSEIRIDERRPFRRDRLRNLSVSIPGQVGKNQLLPRQFS